MSDQTQPLRPSRSRVLLVLVPLALMLLSPQSQVMLLTIIWSTALAGVFFNLVWISSPRWLHTALYLLMGWAALGWIGEFWANASLPVFILISGYTSRHYTGTPRQVRRMVGSLVVPYLLVEIALESFEAWLADEPLLRVRLQARAGAHELELQPLHQPELLGIEPGAVALRMHPVDAREQAAVHVDRVEMRGQQRRHGALDRLQRRRGLARREVAEHRLDALEVAPAAVERCARVVEIRRPGVGGDGVEFVEMAPAGQLERRCEMPGLDLRERWQSVRRVPGLQQGIARRGRRR